MRGRRRLLGETVDGDPRPGDIEIVGVGESEHPHDEARCLDILRRGSEQGIVPGPEAAADFARSIARSLAKGAE